MGSILTAAFGILLILLYVLLGIYFFYTIWAVFSGAPFVPVSKKNLGYMLELTKPKQGEVLYDLGSGDGRVLLAAAKTGVRCVGVEINPLLLLVSRFRVWLSRAKNIDIRNQDIWKTDLSDADVVTLFFIPIKMDKLHQKIQKEMKKGSRVVSCRYEFPNWEPVEKREKVFLYIV